VKKYKFSILEVEIFKEKKIPRRSGSGDITSEMLEKCGNVGKHSLTFLPNAGTANLFQENERE